MSVSQRHLGFLDFSNLHKKFIKNFSKIITSFTLILQIIKLTSNNTLSTQANKIGKNQDILGGANNVDNSDVDRNIEHLSTFINMFLSKRLELIKLKKSIIDKFKKSYLTKFKKLDLAKVNKLNFIMANSSGTDLLLKLKKSLYTYKKHLSRLRFLNILI